MIKWSIDKNFKSKYTLTKTGTALVIITFLIATIFVISFIPESGLFPLPQSFLRVEESEGAARHIEPPFAIPVDQAFAFDGNTSLVQNQTINATSQNDTAGVNGTIVTLPPLEDRRHGVLLQH